MKNLGEKGAWSYPETAQIFRVSQERRKGFYELQIWQVHSQGPSKQKPVKDWEKRERGRIHGLPKFFENPLLSQEWVKLRTSNFVRTFIGSIGTISPLKISALVAVGVLRDLANFQGTVAPMHGI